MPPGLAARAATGSELFPQHRFGDLLLQTHPWPGDVDNGFFLVHITSFNEWHEGHQFEPMKTHAALTPAEPAIVCHNPADGAYC